MLLVPRQLRRSGMTGNVPYYGGRFTPAQAYAASHPYTGAQGPQPPGPVQGGRTELPAAAPARATSSEDTLLVLQQLLDSGVLSQDEYDDLRSRVDL